MKIKAIIFILFIGFTLISLKTNTSFSGFFNFNKWDSQFSLIKIPSKVDGKLQEAYFSSSPIANKPLLVSLHTWTGDFTETDPLAVLALEKEWNYLHPDFRGPNNDYDSCLSELVLSDIDDAISYALKQGNVDPNNIFVVGASGGGYVTLGFYLKTKHKIKHFTSWVPISDLSTWYYQSLSLGNIEYAENIIACTSDGENIFNELAAKKRSPLYWPISNNNISKIDIYAGINDGHNRGGTVPISHSLHFYNHLLSEWGLKDKGIDRETISKLLERSIIKKANHKRIQDRAIIYHKKVERASLTIFDGGHEILTEYTFKKLLELSKPL